jgi:ribonucleoside-diphosphate reductase alpha chain
MDRERDKLPIDRIGVNHHFTIHHMTEDGIRELDGYIRTGCYADGRLGEVFLTIGKAGDEHAWADCWCIAVSIALQYGAPVDIVFKKFVGQRFIPYGGTNNLDIRMCTSVIDYVSRFILGRYSTAALDEKKKKSDGI